MASVVVGMAVVAVTPLLVLGFWGCCGAAPATGGGNTTPAAGRRVVIPPAGGGSTAPAAGRSVVMPPAGGGSTTPAAGRTSSFHLLPLVVWCGVVGRAYISPKFRVIPGLKFH